MAHAYTTKRGKNKKSKLGVRKDQQQNSERQLKHGANLSAFLFDGPKEPVMGIAGHLTGGSSSNSRLEDVRSRLQKAIADKCSNGACENAQSTHLSECAACRQTRYCCRDCQLAHWPSHKEACKAAKKAREQREEEQRLRVLQALEELNLKPGGVSNSVAEESTDLNDKKIAVTAIEEGDSNEYDNESDRNEDGADDLD